MQLNITINKEETGFLEKQIDDFLYEYAELAIYTNPNTKTAKFSKIMVNVISQIKRQIKPETIGERGNL